MHTSWFLVRIQRTEPNSRINMKNLKLFQQTTAMLALMQQEYLLTGEVRSGTVEDFEYFLNKLKRELGKQ